MTAAEPPPLPPPTHRAGVSRLLGIPSYTRRAAQLVWATNRRLGLLLVLLSVLVALLPVAAAYVGKLIVDSVIAAAASQSPPDRWLALGWVGLELVLVAALTAAQRGLGVCDSLLRVELGQRVSELVLEKATTLSLTDFETPEVYDRLTRARQEAAYRPVNLVRGALSMAQGLVTLLACGALLLGFSWWIVLLLFGAALPAFIVEARFSTDAFRLFRWRSPEARRQHYYETVLGRDDHAKEVKLYGLGPLLLERHRVIFRKLYAEDRALTLKRGFWGFLLAVLSSGALYASYAWIAWDAIDSRITIGEMTMYLLIFKQAQSSISASLGAVVAMYADNLFLSTLYEFLDQPTVSTTGESGPGPKPADGIRFEHVCFTYPGEKHPALEDVTLHIPTGTKLALVGENGAGKSTLVKLLARLYSPSAGRILLDGRPLEEWDVDALHRRIGVIFQDFVRYQLQVSDNIGVGDVGAYDDEERWHEAATKADADEFVRALPDGYHTQLGRWFSRGHELSLGEWQKLALARGFMRRDADILVLDEPTASLDAEAETRVFERFGELTDQQTAIVISHRFSTVRMAARIVVLEQGRVIENGSHAELVARGGKYARLFELQAAQYR